jgi:hypothetical protein
MLKLISRVSGVWVYRDTRTDQRYLIQRGLPVADGGDGRRWEILYWTGDNWLASSGKAPEGYFDTLSDAKNALLLHVTLQKCWDQHSCT